MISLTQRQYRSTVFKVMQRSFRSLSWYLELSNPMLQDVYKSLHMAFFRMDFHLQKFKQENEELGAE
jgi:hypothetical protein